MATKCLSPVWKQKASQFAKENNIDENDVLIQLTGIMNNDDNENLSDEEIIYLLDTLFNGSLDTSDFSEDQLSVYTQLVTDGNYNSLNKAMNAIEILKNTIFNSSPFLYKLSDDTYRIGDSNNITGYSKEMLKIKEKALKDGTFMKAPNGKPTNLTEKQWLQVRTKAFKDWFGDWQNNPENASKVVDENGEPLVVYHGTNSKEINEFEVRNLDEGFYGKGIYFTNAEDYADSYGPNHIPVFLNIRDPKEISAEDDSMLGKDITDNDGVIATFPEDTGTNWKEYVVNNPNQIKSATDNIGTFSMSNTNVYNNIQLSDFYNYLRNELDSQRKAGQKPSILEFNTKYGTNIGWNPKTGELVVRNPKIHGISIYNANDTKIIAKKRIDRAVLLNYLQRKFNLRFTEIPSTVYNNKIGKISNCCVIGNTVYIRHGDLNKLTNEQLMEEFLHPVIHALYKNNKEVSSKLIDEAKKNFPDLTSQIKYIYQHLGNDIVNEEIITQVLTKYLNQEISDNGLNTRNLVNYLQQFIQGIINACKDLFGNIDISRIEGRQFSGSEIKNVFSFDNLAQLINSKEISFKDTLHNEDLNFRYNVNNENRENKKIVESLRKHFENPTVDSQEYLSKISDEDYEKLEEHFLLKKSLSTEVYERVANLYREKDSQLSLFESPKIDTSELSKDESAEIKDEITNGAVEVFTNPSEEDRQLKKVMYSKVMSLSEQQFHSDNIMIQVSYVVSNLQSNSEVKNSYFPNRFNNIDFTTMSRQEIIETVGMGNLLNYVKEYYYNLENENGFCSDIDDLAVRDKMRFVYDNFQAFVMRGNAKFQKLEGMSISTEPVKNIEDSGEFNENRETEGEALEHQDREHWMIGFRQLSAKASILNEVKSVLEKRKVYNVETDENGNITSVYPKKDKFNQLFDETINPDKATESILSWCNQCTTIEEMEEILNRLAPQHPWLYSIIGINNENMSMEGLLQKEPFRSQFFHSFRKDHTNYSVSLLDKDDKGNFVWRTKNINTQSAAEFMMDGVVTAYKTGLNPLISVVGHNPEGKGKVNVEKVESIKKKILETNSIVRNNFYNPEDYDTVAKNIAEILIQLGVPDINVSEGLNPIKDAISQDGKAQTNPQWYTSSIILSNADYICTALLNNKDRTDYNPILKSEPENVYSNYKNILASIGTYIEDAVEASVYENGKMYYSFTTPSYMQKEIKKLNNAIGKSQDEYNQWLQDNYGKYTWFKVNDQWRCPWLDIMGKDADARRNLDHKVQICSNKTDYKELSPFGYSISILNEYFSEEKYAWFRVPMLSNKPSNEFIHFKKFTPKTTGANYKNVINGYLTQVVLQEMDRISSIIENAYAPNESKIKNFDISKKVLDSCTPELKEKLRTKTPLTQDDFAQLAQTGANFKFLPFLNEYLQGNKSSDFSKMLVDKINGIEIDEPLFQENLSKLMTDYIDKKADEAFETLKTQGIFHFNSYDRVKEKKKHSFRNYSFLSNIISKSFNDRKEEMLKQEKYKNMNDNELNAVIEKDIENEVKEKITEFIWNDKLASINIIELTTTDLAYYKDSDDFQKRYAEVHSPTMKLNLSATFTDEYGNTIKYSADGMERSIVLKDQEISSDIISSLKNAFNQIIKTRNLTGQQRIDMEAMMDVICTAYTQVNVTDAQAYSSPTAYRKKLGMCGLFTEAMESAYQKVCEGNFNTEDLGVLMQPIKPFVYGQTTKPSASETMPLRKVPQQHKNSEYLLFLADAILRGSNSDSKLIAIFDFMEDSAYSGRQRVRNGKIYEDGRIIGKADANQPEGSIVKRGTYNGKGIDTVQFESAVKVGLQGIVDINNIRNYDEILNTLRNKIYVNPNDITETNSIYFDGSLYNYSDSYNIDYVNHISFEDYGIQQEVPNHFKDHEQLIGSQQRIITIADISDNAYFEVRGYDKPLSKEKLIDEYQSLHAENINASFETLKLDLLLDTNVRKNYIKKQLGKAFAQTKIKPSEYLNDVFNSMKASSRLTTSNSDKKLESELLANTRREENIQGERNIDTIIDSICKDIDFTITKAARNSAMSNLLKDEIKKDQRYGLDLLYSCSINPETGDFNIPLSDPIQSLRIQQLLHSIIKSRINKQTIAGGPVVQTSCFGLSDDLHIVWKQDGTLDYLPCYMPVPSEEIRKAIQRDGYLLTPEQAVRLGILKDEQLKAIGYRIPTEDKYSMLPLKIVGWTPSAAGEAIIMPAEITTMTGSDFDIDKMYVMVKSYETSINSNTKDINFKEITDLNSKEGRNNRIFDIQWSVLTNIDSIDKLFNPGNFDKLKETNNLITILKSQENTLSYNELKQKSNKEIKALAENIAGNSGRNITDFETQIYYFQQNMSAGKLIGIFANNNVSHIFLSLQDIRTQLSDNQKFTFDNITISYAKFDGTLALNGIDRISKNIASCLAASVDAVKDNALSGLNFNTATVNVGMVLARLGFDIESIGLYLSQPVIIETVNDYFIQKDIQYTDLNTVIDGKLNKLFNNNKNSIESLNKDLPNFPFTKEMLASNMQKRDYKTDANILLLLKRLNNLSVPVETMTFMTKFNSVTNAAGPSLASTILMRNRINKFNLLYNSNPMFNKNCLKIFDNSKLLNAFYETTIKEGGAVDLVFSSYFPQMTRSFMGTVVSLDSRMSGNLDERTLNMLVNDYVLYNLTIGTEPIIDCSEQNRNYLFKQFPNKCIDELSKANSLLKDVLHKTSTEKSPVITLQSNVNGLSSDGQSYIKNDWIDLYNNGHEKLALDIAIYNILRGGFGYSPKTITHITPSFIKEHIPGYVEGINTICDLDYGDSYNRFAFLDQFFRNHTNEKKLVAQIDSNKCKGKIIDGKVLVFNINANTDVSNLQTGGNKQDPHYAYLISYNNKLYRFYNGSSNNAVYRETTRLGIPNDFLEYDASKEGENMKSVFLTQYQSDEGNSIPETNEPENVLTVKDVINQNENIFAGVLQQEDWKNLHENPTAYTKDDVVSMLNKNKMPEMGESILKEIDNIINKLNICK